MLFVLKYGALHFLLAYCFLIVDLFDGKPSLAFAGDNFFCGTSWADASENCDDRQPCPGALDDECSSPGQMCFGDTLCSVAAGHGEKFKYMALAGLVEVDYSDVSNTLFCGSWHVAAAQECSLQTHCPDGESWGCPSQQHCFVTTCNIQDLVRADLGEDWVDIVTEHMKGGSDVSKMGPDNPKRKNFCGIDWGQASNKCTQWCAGNDEPGECPKGQKCFSKTSCYYDDDLQPTMSPISTFTPTRSPILRDDPSNFAFCGNSWALAIQNCSPETNCKFDRDCAEEGQQCYPSLPGCNLNNMAKSNAIQNPGGSIQIQGGSSDPSDFRFCGTSWDDASENCSLSRHCPNYVCSDPKLSCFDNLSFYAGAEFCNAHEMQNGSTRAPALDPTSEAPTPAPTSKSTPSPSKSPTSQPVTAIPTTASPTKVRTNAPVRTDAPVQIINGLCAKSFQNLKETYPTAQKCSNIDPCDAGQICYPNVDVASLIQPPSKSPSTPPSKPPSTRPTVSPVTRKPSLSPTRRPITYSPTYWYSYTPTAPMRYYCATSFAELETSCERASECDFSSRICPPGHACMPYNDCKETQQKPDLETEEGIKSTPWNYLPDLCPLGFVGKRSEDCTEWRKCRDGLLEDSGLCELGKLFDNTSGKCVNQRLVDYNCESIEVIWNDEQDQPNQSEGDIEPQQKPDSGAEEENQPSLSNYSPDLCPLGFVGLHSPAGNCNHYYECDDGLLMASHTCDMFLMFDNGLGGCISQQFINSKCESIGNDGNNDQNQPNETKGDDTTKPHSTLETEEDQSLGTSKEDEQNRPNQSEGDIEPQQNQSIQSIYSPDLCPLGFVGLHSPAGNCNHYYECDDGLLMASHTCDMFLMFDNGRGECISQQFINYKCESIGNDGNNDQNQPNETKGDDTTKPHSTLETEDDQSLETLPIDSKEGNHNVSQPGSFSENEAKQTSNKHDQLVASGGKNNELEHDAAPDDEGDLQVVAQPGDCFPELCPLGFNVFHAKEDCTKYYRCIDGCAGLVHTCSAGFMFDKVRDKCIPRDKVSPYCYGPALTAEEEQNLELEKTMSPKPSFSSTSVGRPMASSNSRDSKEDSSFLWPDTASPTVPKRDPHFASWLREYDDNGQRAPTRMSFYLFTLVLLPTFWVIQIW